MNAAVVNEAPAPQPLQAEGVTSSRLTSGAASLLGGEAPLAGSCYFLLVLSLTACSV